MHFREWLEERKVRSGYLPFRTNASTLPISRKRSSSRDVGTSSYRYHTATGYYVLGNGKSETLMVFMSNLPSVSRNPILFLDDFWFYGYGVVCYTVCDKKEQLDEKLYDS
ncbi:hypothetical protein TNCV_1611651 [Trichonephila clavipes]|nr:hypothetical protein TNCV_1611651 [Trichonephila clavipes]